MQVLRQFLKPLKIDEMMDDSKLNFMNFVEVLEPKTEEVSDLNEKDPLNICDTNIALVST